MVIHITHLSKLGHTVGTKVGVLIGMGDMEGELFWVWGGLWGIGTCMGDVFGYRVWVLGSICLVLFVPVFGLFW